MERYLTSLALVSKSTDTCRIIIKPRMDEEAEFSFISYTVM